MKSLKFALIAAIVACTMVSLARDGRTNTEPRKVAVISFSQAIQNPGLVVAIYQQVDPGFLNNYVQNALVDVVYNGTLYRISGTYENWVSFFNNRWLYMRDSRNDGKPWS